MSTHRQARKQAIAKARFAVSQLAITSRNVNLVNKRLNQTSSESPDIDDNQSVSLMTFDKIDIRKMADIDTFNEKYQLGRKIGEGSNGVVRECVNHKKNKIYACKSMMFDDEHIPLLEKSFLDVRRLQHPNIVKYKALYLDLEKHLAYLVMEFINLPNLTEFVRSLPQPVQENEIKWIFLQLFKTLQHIHQKGVSHRDIKPENIMIDGAAKKIKIIDFGIARRMIVRRQKINMLTITGTLFYRAPQMFLGGGYSEKVDIWAAGVSLYQVIFGETPFASEYHSETIENIQTLEIKQDSFPECNTVSELLKDLISRLLRKNPDQRFTARQALRHLWFQKEGFKLKQRYSDFGHIVETQYSKFEKKAVEINPISFKECKSFEEVKTTNSPTYHRMQVEDF